MNTTYQVYCTLSLSTAALSVMPFYIFYRENAAVHIVWLFVCVFAVIPKLKGKVVNSNEKKSQFLGSYMSDLYLLFWGFQNNLYDANPTVSLFSRVCRSKNITRGGSNLSWTRIHVAGCQHSPSSPGRISHYTVFHSLSNSICLLSLSLSFSWPLLCFCRTPLPPSLALTHIHTHMPPHHSHLFIMSPFLNLSHLFVATLYKFLVVADSCPHPITSHAFPLPHYSYYNSFLHSLPRFTIQLRRCTVKENMIPVEGQDKFILFCGSKLKNENINSDVGSNLKVVAHLLGSEWKWAH